MDEVRQYLKQLYNGQSQQIIDTLTEFKQYTPRFDKLYNNALWFKHLNLYVVYPDSFYRGEMSFLERLTKQLPYIYELGCNAIHILPFLDSPCVDKGFDVSNYTRVRDPLGSIAHLEQLVTEARKLRMHLFMDLVFNHTSDQHEWFQRAINGDEQYRNFYIWTDKQPKFIKKVHKDAAVWAEYEIDGEQKLVNIAFPEYAGEIPHWVQQKDGNWYYHTYYPQQPDLNWNNPELFTELAKTMMFWASWGFNFRMDAIPFIGKMAYKAVDDDNDKTFLIAAALNALGKEINPECSFLVETYERLDTVIKYFGTTNSPQANLAYNFHLCTNLWVGLLKKDANYIWNILERTDIIPRHGEWINFLRNHDELSLAYLNDDLKNAVSEELLEQGEPFREGYGISGRTFSFLKKNVKRYLMSYFLTVSLPGGISIPYGDEIGMENIPLQDLPEQEQKDTRNINRGIITQKMLSSSQSKTMYKKMKEVLGFKHILREYVNVWPQKLQLNHYDPQLFTMAYTLGTSQLSIIINLGNETKQIDNAFELGVPAATVNRVTVTSRKLELGPYAGVWMQR